MKTVTIVTELRAGGNAVGFNAAYPEGMDACLCSLVSDAGYKVNLIHTSPEHDGSALTDEILQETDVLIWWGHAFHHFVLDSVADKVVAMVQRGMGFIALHSSHNSKPFIKLMGTTCSLSWREAAERERVWTIDPSHPIARGVEQSFVIEHEEMYGEPFDIPTPDELVFIGWFRGGEVMRSGCVWNRGRGKVFFFQPGHETFAVYKNENVRKVVLNAIEYVAPAKKYPPFICPNITTPLEKLD